MLHLVRFADGGDVDTTVLSPRTLLPILAQLTLDQRLEFGTDIAQSMDVAFHQLGITTMRKGDPLESKYRVEFSKELLGRAKEHGILL